MADASQSSLAVDASQSSQVVDTYKALVRHLKGTDSRYHLVKVLALVVVWDELAVNIIVDV